MHKSPSRPTQRVEAPNASFKFRAAIYLALAGCLSGISSYIGYREGQKSSKDKIAQVADKEECPVCPEMPEIFTNAPKLNATGPVCEKPSDEEIVERANDITAKRNQEIADGLAKKFCITNPDDQEDILRAVGKGYTLANTNALMAAGGKKYDSWELNLTKADNEKNQDDEEDDINIVFLRSKPGEPCSSKVIAEKEEKKKRDKKIIDDIKSGNVKQYLAELDVSKMKAEMASRGISTSSAIPFNEYIALVDRLKNEDFGSMNAESASKIICGLLGRFSSLAKSIDSSDDKELGNELMNSEAFNINGLLKFIGYFSDSYGLERSKMRECFN